MPTLQIRSFNQSINNKQSSYDLPIDKFEFIGNSSLSGARRALLSHKEFEKAKIIAQEMTYIELSIESSFMDEYIGAMFFPHTNTELFPSVADVMNRKLSFEGG